MKNLEKIKIKNNETIKQALKVITNGNIKIAIVVDSKNKLIGTLSDGDIRRGFLKGLDVESPIISVINTKPLFGRINDNKKKLIKYAISKKIYQIPIVNNKKKFVDILLTDEITQNEIKLNKVVIMAGGKGTRLRPLTKNTPKPMLKVGNKPILETIIQSFSNRGFKDLIICVNYKSHAIEKYFGNGNKFGVTIKYFKETKKMGTAGAISFLKKDLIEPFFVINGDLLTNLNFEKMMDFHNTHSAVATMGVKEYVINSPYGEVKTFNEKIISINEKPAHKFFANAGIYILNPMCIDLIPKNYFDMTTLFKKIILKKKKTASFPLNEYWKDIGSLTDFEKANEEFLKKFKI
jgi:dTDP-glucose pyrophosphorylase/CBS domain-containing protein